MAIRAHKHPKRVIAEAAGLTIGVLSHWMEGVNRADKHDPRIQKVAEVIGFPKEKIFEAEFAS